MHKRRSIFSASVVGLALFASPMLAQSAPCGISKVVEWKQAVYPPIAKAAHVSGAVVMLVQFDQTGNPLQIKMVSGPELLRKAAKDSVEALAVNAFSGVRECPVVITFEIGDCDKRGPYAKSELPHQYVCAEPMVLSDPAGTLTRRRRF